MLGMDKGWDKEMSLRLQELLGVGFETSMQIVGIIAEERMHADLLGFARGWAAGLERGYEKAYKEISKEAQDVAQELNEEED